MWESIWVFKRDEKQSKSLYSPDFHSNKIHGHYNLKFYLLHRATYKYAEISSFCISPVFLMEMTI